MWAAQGRAQDHTDLANGSGGVAGGVQGVGASADVLTHGSHLGDATGVVRDGAVRVNGQACVVKVQTRPSNLLARCSRAC